ncbi:MAG: hypothetical protein M1550_03760 [Deltaproteobacteria bacterium]|nr:hypothetical protein [Deltaproteobacteria bacterium]
MGEAGSRMLSGFNHNLKYKGRIFHVQTEDGGREAAQVISHVFHGGVILDTARQSYRDLFERPDWRDALRERMKAQHLEEIRKLYSGLLDARMQDLLGDD